MKTIFAAILSTIIFISSAKAENAKFYANVFDIVKNEYLYETNVKELAEKGLSGLSNMDEKILVADGVTTSSIYYNGKIVKTLVKPANADNIQEWSEYVIKGIEAAVKFSPKIAAKDFEIEEYILMSIFSHLDKDTRYYPYLEVGDKKNPVRTHYFADRMIDDKILYMKLGPLNIYTRDSILESFANNQNFESLIIDLRGNPGGLLSEAVSIVKVFLDQGIIASSMARKDGIMKYYIADEDSVSVIKDKPVIILVDGDTASSAEVLAAGLKEQSVAKIVGTKTRGKGTVQKLITLDNGGELVLTTAYFYTPSGNSVNEVGLNPNICMYDIEDDANPEDILNSNKKRLRGCIKQSRANYNIDLDVAVEMLK